MMRTTQKVYCDFQFIRTFFIDSPYEKGSSSIKDFTIWNDIYHFIQNSTIEFYNSDESDLLELKNELGENCDIFEPVFSQFVNFEFVAENTLSKIGNNCEKLNSIYLTNLPDAECQEISQKYGILVFNYKNIEQKSFLFRNNGRSIPKDSQEPWKNLLDDRISYTCNSLILSDNYILDSSKINAKINKNLTPILNKILPRQLKVPFYITFFCGNIPEGQEKKIFERICNIVKSLRPNLEIKISLYRSSKRLPNDKYICFIHDRTIITNNIWFSCNGGFDLFDEHNKATKETHFDLVFPSFIKNTSLYHDSYLNQIYNINEIIRKYARNMFFITNDNSKKDKNRLIEYYKD